MAVSEVEPGLALTTTVATPAPERRSATTPATRSVYRLLIMKGMSPAEAANLTAMTCGLPTADIQWSLKQINQVLFLRAMYDSGRFRETDGGHSAT